MQKISKRHNISSRRRITIETGSERPQKPWTSILTHHCEFQYPWTPDQTHSCCDRLVQFVTVKITLTPLSRLSDPDDPDLPYQRKKNTRPGKTVNPEALKAELKALLREPLMARGVSARYPTSGSKVIIDDLLGASGKSPTIIPYTIDLALAFR